MIETSKYLVQIQTKPEPQFKPRMNNPSSKSSSEVLEDHLLDKPFKIIDSKKTFRFLKPHISFYHFAWLLIILLFQIFILLAFLTTSPGRNTPPAGQFPPIHLQKQQEEEEGINHLDNKEQSVQPHGILEDNEEKKCKHGKIYMYDNIPPMFNKELLKNCRDLHPRMSLCAAVSNNGFGPTATSLAGTVPENLTHSWHWTYMFAGEIIFHARMSNYRCRTLEPESAAAFYVPFYAGLSVTKYLFTNFTAKERDAPCERLLDWIKDQPYWKRSNGSDHFLMLGRTSWDFKRTRDEDWGTSFLRMPLMRNMFQLTIERSLNDPLEVGVPYPSGFHPRSKSEIEQWQEFVRSRERRNLFTFVGGKRGNIKNDFRALLLDHCYNESDSCKPVDCEKTPCLDGTSVVLEVFLDSNFCLQPRGDSLTRRSTFDCMLAGSIPVFFWKETVGGQYELFMSSLPDSFSVFIHRNEVRNGTSIRKVLEAYSQEDIKRMRANVIDMIPRILYAFPDEGLANVKDAFDIGVEELLRKIRKYR